MKRFLLVSAVLACSMGFFMLNDAAFARGGDSFIGGFGGGMMGSMVGSAMTSKSSESSSVRSDASGAEALKEVGRLEAIMRNDLNTLNSRISDLKQDVPSQEDLARLTDDVKSIKESVQTLEREAKNRDEQLKKQEQEIEELKKLLQAKDNTELAEEAD